MSFLVSIIVFFILSPYIFDSATPTIANLLLINYTLEKKSTSWKLLKFPFFALEQNQNI